MSGPDKFSFFNFDGKSAVIIGGGSAIRRSVALKFAMAGASVSVLDLSLENAESVCHAIVTAGGKAEAFVCDVGHLQDLKKVFEKKAFDEQKAPILVNNAGISHIGTVKSTSEEDFDRILRVNVKGFYNPINASIGHMKRCGGVILNMASICNSIASTAVSSANHRCETVRALLSPGAPKLDLVG